MSDFDAITEESLVTKGGRKWSSFPGSIGAFIAEMDFDPGSSIDTVRDTFPAVHQTNMVRQKSPQCAVNNRSLCWDDVCSPARVEDQLPIIQSSVTDGAGTRAASLHLLGQ